MSKQVYGICPNNHSSIYFYEQQLQETAKDSEFRTVTFNEAAAAVVSIVLYVLFIKQSFYAVKSTAAVNGILHHNYKSAVVYF